MKYDVKEKIIISDPELIKEKDLEFEKLKEKFDEKKHGSMTEEMKRNIRTVKRAKILYPLEQVFKLFINLSAKDINGNLEGFDLAEGNYYYSSKKTGENLIKVDSLEKESEFGVKLYTGDHQIHRVVHFKGNDKIAKIKLVDDCKGMETVFGLLNNYKKVSYQKSVKISFEIQILQLYIELTDDEKYKTILQEKIKRLQKKSKKYIY
ncbi:hypothetical protein [Spiroplasma culicicola]|uniref:Uncharacterized protein n=1 Tax=Spiroplasma culicicola AES-1 TaxID=1276246 RepID=W6A6S9_9MOLU|nr:hypothetical protein [Spiroplasma culicicola]AHI52580.1 hypothetical protein SCULI_v1c02390 [Spiroplasma culicicola AES-1]